MSSPLTPVHDETIDATRNEAGGPPDPDATSAETNTSGPTDAPLGEPEARSTEPQPTRSGPGLIALALGALLLISAAVHLKQSRDVSNLEARSLEYQQALAAAVERIDAEAARADGAEAALDRVDRAVDVVNERVLGLQEALDQLREATVR